MNVLALIQRLRQASDSPQLVEKALEWDMSLFLMDGDVRKAYDFTKHSKATLPVNGV